MSKNILLIDDDEVERTALRKIIQTEPTWRLTEAKDGQEGLDVLCDGLKPQLCVIDLVMPKVGGLELLRRIRRDPGLRNLKAMVASGTRDRATIIELAKLHIEGYVLKPFDPERTLAALRPVLATIPDPDDKQDGVRNLFAKKILLVEDDPVSRATLRAIIRQDRLWEIIEAVDGQEALEKLQAGLKPDLCFVDLNMPRLDGVALLTALRNDPRLQRLRVVVMSSGQDRGKISSLAQLRMDAYLLKPCDPIKVRSILHAAAPV